MGLVPIRKFEIQDASSRVRSVLPGWKPSKGKSRRACARELREFLTTALEGFPVSEGREIGGMVSDLTLADEVLIEIHKDLATPRSYAQLIKRLDAFKDWGAVILVVLLGTVAPGLRRKLDDHINFLNNDLEWTDHKDIVILRK